jgi:hypothetical protein
MDDEMDPREELAALMLLENPRDRAKVIDRYRDQVRAQTLAEADAYLTRHGYADSAYLLRTCDIPRT